MRGNRRRGLAHHRDLTSCWAFFCAPNRHDDPDGAINPAGHEGSAANFCNVYRVKRTSRGRLNFGFAVAASRRFSRKRQAARKIPGMPLFEVALNTNIDFNKPARRIYDSPSKSLFFRLLVKLRIKEVLISRWIRTSFFVLGKLEHKLQNLNNRRAEAIFFNLFASVG